jgi:hypothetical protein
MATTEPVGPLVGVNPVMLGLAEAVTVNDPVLVAAPPGVVIVIGPDVAPGGTTTVAEVAVTVVGTAVTSPVNATCVVPVNAVPNIVTVVPIGPEVGVNDEILGAATTVQVPSDETAEVPPADVTTTVRGPNAAPGAVTMSAVKLAPSGLAS